MCSTRFITRMYARKWCMLLLAIVLSVQQVSEAQQSTEEDQNAGVILTYNVADLVMNTPDYSYSDFNQPHPSSMRMGGVIGNGSINSPMAPSVAGKYTMMDLQYVICSLVAPETWNHTSAAGLQMQRNPQMGGAMGPGMGMGGAMGGPGMAMGGPAMVPENQNDAGGEGNLMQLGNSLVISQTPAVHRQIENLLKQLRADSGKQKTVSIDARWLLLGSDDLDRLISTDEDGCPRVDRKMLAEYTRRPSSIRAITNCFTGQLVYLISGTHRNIVSGYIPVVGSADSPQHGTMHLASMGAGPLITNAQNVSRSSVGYQPLIEKTNLGTLLEIRATLVPDENRAVVDLRSTITMPGKWRTDAEALAEQIAQNPLAPVVDRIATKKQEMATTLSMPLRQPILAGGITFAVASDKSPQASAAEEASQMYLVLELR